ncbi:unnamed protein product [Porites lobata]|uniref:Ion transport domain-containing protein n=1 Tax=Porites lobata TaxID=104759 RepID=A0ABN8NDK4_9CNID|nr:unnamed protein product [Porites lobata]
MKQIIDFARKPSEHKFTGLSLFKAKLKGFIFTYSRDRWNVFDFLTFVVYIFAILPLRIAIWVESESVNNNRILAVAGYLYGVNTMFLTLRAFGSLLETTKGVGTVQIAFFHIIGDAVVVVVHFLAITVAFASTITKVFVAEKTMVSKNTPAKQPVCNKSGIQCWWKIAKHLGWSLLDLSEGLSTLESTDSYSETLAQLLFAAYLIFALILLINMLIALLSNTYQRVQDNSRNEWVFKRAIAVQTYLNYHPIPVPWNVLYIPTVWIYNLICKRKVALKKTSQWNIQDDLKFLLDKYRLKYGDSFPPKTNKIDQLLDDAENTESMVNQILYRTFTHQKCHDKALLPTGAKAWEAHEAILVDGYLITRQPYERKVSDWRYGARYTKPFSPRFPHFEVMILESGETRWLGIGVVFDHYGTDKMPGWREETVGFHTDDSKIFDTQHCDFGKRTIGSTAARRGDVIRCTVVFEEKREVDGQIRVPVVFSVNGSKIIPKDKNQPSIEYSMDKPLFPYLMCAREDIDFQGQELTSNIAELQTKLECVEKNFDTKLECVQSKLDALLEKLGEGKKNK